MKAYLDLLRHIQSRGVPHADRTGVGTTSVFGYQFRHDLANGFPVLTTKRIPFRAVVAELMWFLRGQTNVFQLRALGATIWDEWADPESGELGRVYGAQWRDFGGGMRVVGDFGTPRKETPQTAVPKGFDQIKWLVEEIRRNPESRRLIVTAWNPDDVLKLVSSRKNAPPPACHTLFQVRVQGGCINLHMFQRSADAFLGVPFNIASYALLIHILANCTGYQPGELVISFTDLHIYNNHREQVAEQLKRWPKGLPTLKNYKTENPTWPWEYNVEDFGLDNYEPLPAIKAEVAV